MSEFSDSQKREKRKKGVKENRCGANEIEDEEETGMERPK